MPESNGARINTPLEPNSQHETELSNKDIQVLATFYVGGMLTLLEQFLNGQLAVPQAEIQVATLKLLRILRQGAVQSDILSLKCYRARSATEKRAFLQWL